MDTIMMVLAILNPNCIMISKKSSKHALSRLFRRCPVVTIDSLFLVLQTGSRMSVHRRLREVGYHSSYTHAGKYYTSYDKPDFDTHGLWFWQGVGFSRAATLKLTIVHLVNTAPEGCTHHELENLLLIRVHNTLLDLVNSGEISRDTIGKKYIYLKKDTQGAQDQLSLRHAATMSSIKETTDLPPTTVIEVLVEAIRAGRNVILPCKIARSLSGRGIAVETQQVNRIFEQYGLETEKKTAQ
jgi:hypothetical protein